MEFLRREEAKLNADVEKVKKGEEIKPKVESFIERVQDLREEILIVIGKVAPVPNTQISLILETHLRDIYGDDIEIVRAPISEALNKENIIVKLSATKGYENLPQIILNAHKDIHDHGYHIGIGDDDHFIPTGALDDRAGVVSILQALRLLTA